MKTDIKSALLREGALRSRSLFVTVLSVALLLIVTLATILIYYRKRQALVMELYKKNLELLEIPEEWMLVERMNRRQGRGRTALRSRKEVMRGAITDTDK